MTETLKKNRPTQIALIGFVFFTIWWLYLRFSTTPDNLQNQLFAAVYGVMALWGGLWGLQASQNWGGFKSVMGRALMMFALGLLLQEFGQLTYSYYIYFSQIEIPYPSIGDIGYFGSIPCYIYGVWLIAKASGVRISLKSTKSLMVALAIPTLMVSIGYYLFLLGYEFDWSSPLVIFLDFGYPLAQAIYVSLAILTYLLSLKVLGGIMKSKILLILLALIIQFLSDYVFLYQVIHEGWYAGGFNDYMYLSSYTLMSISLFYLTDTARKLKSK